MNKITKISRWLTKSTLLLMFFLAQPLTSFAEVKLYMENFTIYSGQEKEVALLLDNDKAATVLEVTVNLPAGLEYVDESVSKTSRIAGRGATVQASTATGKLKIVETDGKIAAGEGAIITFKVREKNLRIGSTTFSLSNIVVSDKDAQQLNEVETVDVTVLKLGLSDCKFGAPEAFEIAVGAEYQVDVTLDNEGFTTLAGLQGNLLLPEGLEIVDGEEGKFIYSERTPSPLQFKFTESEGKTFFLLSSSNNTKILDSEGVLFSFKVKANADLAETAEIKLTELRLATSSGESELFPTIVISVTNATIKQLKADMAAFDAYKAEQKAAVDTLALDTDTDDSKQLIADAKAAVEALAFDEAKTLEENKAAVDAIVAALVDALAAQREADQLNIAVTVNAESMGSATGSGIFIKGSTATLTATANEGYHFVNWTINDAEVSTESTYSFVTTESVTVVANFAPNQYTVKFVVDEQIVSEQSLDFGATIVAPEAPEKEGHTFAGWNEVDATVPAHDVTYTGSYTINSYVVRYYVDEVLWAEDVLEFGAPLVLREYTSSDPERWIFLGWLGDSYDTMPAYDIFYLANLKDGIISLSKQNCVDVWTVDGKKVNSKISANEINHVLPRGIYIINGKKVTIR